MKNISEIYGFHKMHFHQLFEDLPAHGFQNFLYQNKFIFQFHFLWTLGGALINVYVHLFIFLRSLMILVHMFLFQLIFVIGYCSAIPSLQVSLLRSRTPTRLEVTRMQTRWAHKLILILINHLKCVSCFHTPQYPQSTPAQTLRIFPFTLNYRINKSRKFPQFCYWDNI